MDVERIAMFAGVGFAIAVGLFVLWGPSPKPRKKGDGQGYGRQTFRETTSLFISLRFLIFVRKLCGK